jgi:hypothetical protein
MFRALALVLGLIASPAAAQQIVCVSSIEKADEAARLSGEQLVWIGETAGGVVMRFYRGATSWTVMYQVSDRWCTAPHMLGVILETGEA